MDLHTRQLVDEAIALDDKMRAECVCWEAKRAERARTQLVYKVHEPKVAAQRQPTVSAEWVQAQLNAVASVIGAEVGKTQPEIVRKLREEIAALRAEIDHLRQQQKRAEICPASYHCKGERREC
jgi:hypothetical protein